MSKSLPVLIPAKEPTPTIFDPRSNPESLALNNPIVPSVTNLFDGPVICRLVLRVPAVNFDPDGKLIASAGKKDSRSVAGSPSPFTFISTTNSSPSDLYVPVKFDFALPIFTVEGFSTPEPFTISYLVSKS